MKTTVLFDYQKILLHTLINGSMPALIMDDYSVRIMLISGMYFTKEAFMEEKQKLLKVMGMIMVTKIQAAYFHDWRKELGEGKGPGKHKVVGPEMN